MDDRVTVVSFRATQDIVDRMDDLRGDQSRSDWLLAAAIMAGTERPAKKPSAARFAAAPQPPKASEGLLCSAPRCWARDAALYGRVPLCPACYSSVLGITYVMPRRAPLGSPK